MFQCKSQKSLGTFFLQLANTNCIVVDKPVGTARGNVTIFVPENMRLTYEPNALVIERPQLMSAITPHGIDILKLQALEFDDSENGKCDRVIQFAAGYFKDLRELIIDTSDVSDQGLAHLPNMPHLEAINAMACHLIKGQCFQGLSKLPNLQRINLRGHQVDGYNCKYLPLFPKLIFLNLRATKINDAALMEISRCPRLEELNLSDNNLVGDNGVAAVSAMKHLRKLDLARTGVTDRGLESISKSQSLKCLGLDNTGVTLKGLVTLKKLKLDELRLSARFSEQELKKIRPLAAQVILGFHSEQIDQDVKEGFAPLH